MEIDGILVELDYWLSFKFSKHLVKVNKHIVKKVHPFAVLS
jgi:hypothetical protein